MHRDGIDSPATVMEYAPFDRVNHALSQFQVMGLFGAGLLVWVVVMLALAVVSALRAKSAKAEVTDLPAMRPGEVLLPGVVELAPGETGAPVALTLYQYGEERRSKNGYYVVWNETSRVLHARPFYLRLGSGHRVRVEPGQEVHLVDTLEPAVRQAGTAMRSRMARLDAGERVWLGGALAPGFDPHALAASPSMAGGYREAAGQQWVLRAGRFGKLFASSEPVESRFWKRTLFFALWALAGIAVGAVFHVTQADYHRLRTHGVEMQARVTSTRSYQVRVKNGYRTHYVADVEVLNGSNTFTHDEVSRNAFYALSNNVGAIVPAIVDPQDPTLLQLGGRRELGVSTNTIVFSWLTALFLVGGQIATWFARRPWHERKKYNETHSGRLYPNY